MIRFRSTKNGNNHLSLFISGHSPMNLDDELFRFRRRGEDNDDDDDDESVEEEEEDKSDGVGEMTFRFAGC